ncbi:Uu.00g085700.m01.CDS01 [Anthostomella pinea]|uniref:Uu.00g085700.m01.CDS01 n=1 Tax=Anthostomella pinea TaxID=933095 RepID=A0AAI8VM12_9PEZI|nr:Uu.00g085700.m01.CDS01 [Anthostomella pinea]
MSSTAQTSVSTPVIPPATPVVDSPGTWQHPRMQEITRRQEASSFTDRNVRRIVINVCVFISLIVLHTFFAWILPSKRSFPYQLWYYSNYAYWALLSLPILNIAYNLLPLIRPKDDLADIPLTPGQRQLLGLPASSGPPTPGSVYSTPPRYSRTPSASGSAASKRSFSGSPLSNRSPSNHGSPSNGNVGASPGGFASPGHHLLQKAVFGARRSSLGSMGSPSPMGNSTGALLFAGGPESPSPSPTSGKRSTVGLNSKWRYEKGLYDKVR